MGYTKSQLEAINYKTGNILVSASAGSGKTGVLKERVITKLKNGIDIDKLVILTFTKAAAEEMKSRIINEIESLNLTDQLPKIDNAIISTFDAFTLRLVTEYHYLLGLDKDITISDQVLIKIRKQETIKKVLEKYYLNNDEAFKLLFKRYFNKSDGWLEDSVYKIGEALRKLADYEQYICDYADLYQEKEFIELNAKKYIKQIIQKLKDEYQDFSVMYLEKLPAFDEKFQEYILNVKTIVDEIINEDDENVIIIKIINFKRPTKPKNKELSAPAILDVLKDIKDEFKKLFVFSYDDLLTSVKSSFQVANELLKIVTDYLDEFNRIKAEEMLYSYEDIMFFAIKLFEDFDDIRLKFINNIHEILIDEYQDTNDLQDWFISLIANNNVFMVGDVKQSIYRFRDANPKNFMRIYREYNDHNTGKAIFLQENFRSNRFVLEAINQIFKQIMTYEVGGVDYEDEQVLKTGYDEDYLLHDANAFETKVYDINLIKDDYPNQTREETEAHLVAQDILKRMEDNEEIYDLKLGKKRSLAFSDFTVLVDRKKAFLTYAKVISKYNIPIDIYDDEPFFSSDEIRFVFQYLLLINCFKDDKYFKKYFKTSLYAVARSFVYRIKDEVIAKFLAFESLEEIADISKLSNDTSLRIIYQDINDIIAYYWDYPPSKILEIVYQKTNIYLKIAELNNPRQKEEKLDFFLLKVKAIKEFTYQELIMYLEAIIETEDFDIEYAEKKNNVNAVKLMSIHKSKGLQFPIVYLIGLYKQFMNMENKEPFIFNKDYGILTKSYQEGFYPNFLQKLYFNEVESENVSEKVRLLYVAMTRAINKIVLVLDYDESFLEKKHKILSFKHLLYQTIKIDENMIEEFKIPSLVNQKKALNVSEEVIEFKRFDFSYEKLVKVRYSKAMTNFLDDDAIKMIDKGNEYHQLLEIVDFNDLENSIKDFPNNLKQAIKNLVNQPLFTELKNPKFYQEYEFYQEKENRVLRGIIDLLIIAEDRVITLDYKLKNIDDEAYVKQLKGYYDFLKEKIDKPIKLFLYSLFDNELKEVIL
jgi:ATP-dependent helicase/nuclease subunit A